MENITKILGDRIRGFRRLKRLSQEQLAEKSSLHPTYIGQLERGEKNATVESIQKIAYGLEVPLEQLFENLSPKSHEAETYIPDKIMFVIENLSPAKQKVIYDLVIVALKLQE